MKEEIRTYIRQVLEEAICNFIKPQPETQTRQIEDDSESIELGDPLRDIKLNTMDGKTGSDSTSPTVSVTPGEARGGTDVAGGMRKPKFNPKTRQA